MMILMMVSFRFFLGYLLVINYGNVYGYDEGIILGSTVSKLIGTILRNVDGINLGLAVGTKLVSSDEFFDDSNCGKLEGLFLGDSLGSTHGKVYGSDEGIILRLLGGKGVGAILENVY